jgi:hypothetical protein
MAALPLLVFDTNILMDVLLGRDAGAGFTIRKDPGRLYRELK